MKTTCLQEHLRKSLITIERIVGRNLTLPILNNVLLKTEKGKLKISSTNLEIGINTWIPAKVDQDGSITVPVKILSSFISGLPSGKKVQMELKNEILIIRCEKFKAEINSQSADEFPIIPKVDGKNINNLPIDEFINGLTQVVDMAAQTETRPEFSGILAKFEKNNLKLAATDGFRLAEKNINFANNEINSLVIPQRTIQEILRIIQDKDGNKKNIKLILGNNQILVEFGDVQLISRLIEGQYPDYQTIIPKSFVLEVFLNKKELEESIRLAGFFSSKISDVKFLLQIDKNVLKIFSQNVDVGANESQIDASVKGSGKGKNKELSISFNFKYLIDGLNNIKNQKVFLGFNNESSPLLLRGENDDSYIYVVMPLKV